MDNILSVRQLTDRLRHTLEQRFPFVWVRGEVTNLSRPSSGHMYFSLKEGDALLSCVWFRGSQQSGENFDPLTGEVFENGPRPSLAHTLTNGKELVCAGRLSVYAPRGSYQLVVELAQETGLGRWHEAFEALKGKLTALGWFSQERKRPVPFNPERVALITATTGAAVRDFIRISSERGIRAHIRIYPTPVQGDDAPPRIVEALNLANEHGWAQVAVLVRGGGSIQDLWAFNDESVAEAIYHSRLPVLTGIGHEIDHSIADFVADRCAATPSHAAQMLWSERETFVQRVDDMEGALRRAMEKHVEACASGLSRHEGHLRMLSPFKRLAGQETMLALLSERLLPAFRHHLNNQEARLAGVVSRLSRQGHDRTEKLERDRDMLAERLIRLGRLVVENRERELERIDLRLKAVNPTSPLERGYALIHQCGRGILSGVNLVAPGDRLVIEMKDGEIGAEVRDIITRKNN